MPQDNSIPLQAFQGQSPVDNFLSSYSASQQQAQGNEMYKRKIGALDQADEERKRQLVADALIAVPDGDAAAFEQVKQRLVSQGVIDAQTASQYDVSSLGQIKMMSQKWRDMKTFEADQQAAGQRGRLTEAQIAAANRSNRPQSVGVAGPGGQVLPSNEQIDNEAKLRGEYTGQLKEFVQVRDAFGRVATAAQDPSAAGDLALIFNYMKMLDPGSVVREQEFANAQNAAGVPERIRAAYNNALKGERLTEATRTDFVDRASRLFENQLGGANKTREVYSGLAGQYGFDPSRVTPDLSLGVTTDITRPKAKPTFTGSGVLQDQSRASAPVDNISAADALLGLK